MVFGLGKSWGIIDYLGFQKSSSIGIHHPTNLCLLLYAVAWWEERDKDHEWMTFACQAWNWPHWVEHSDSQVIRQPGRFWPGEKCVGFWSTHSSNYYNFCLKFHYEMDYLWISRRKIIIPLSLEEIETLPYLTSSASILS
jgi:hypothetical protein